MAKLKWISAVALAGLFSLSSDSPSQAARESGTRQAVLAAVGEVHDGVLAALARDPRYAIKDASDRIEATATQTDKPYTIVALISRSTNEESELEVVYQGNGSADEKKRVESDFLRQVVEAIKYAETGYNRAPDLKSPLDEGPKADSTPRVPAVDNVRRY